MVAGVALIGLALLDVLAEVLQYGGDGPVTPQLSTWVWRGVRGLAGLAPERYTDTLLNAAVPIMLSVTVIAWGAMLLVGFALLYVPASWGGLVSLSPDLLDDDPWLNALYLSAAALSTVGFGDVTAAEPVVGLVTTGESLLGFALITLAVTFLLNVQSAVKQANELVASLRTLVVADGPATRDAQGYGQMLRVVAPHVVDGHTRQLDARLSDIYERLLAYRESLHRFPFLYYYRSRRGYAPLPTLLHVVGGLTAALRWGLPPDHPARRSPYLDGLAEACGVLVGDVLHPMDDRSATGAQRHSDDLLAERWSAIVGSDRAPSSLSGEGWDPEAWPEEHLAFLGMARAVRHVFGLGTAGTPPATLPADFRDWCRFTDRVDELLDSSCVDLVVEPRSLRGRGPSRA